MAEFTGERVIPDMVDPNLLNEHLARYRFAARLCDGAAVLDAGCGSGYGTAELNGAASVTAADISAEALAYAREHFGRPGVRFVNAACEALPFADGSFDLITAFEVIEHLERWPDLLAEAHRVLKPGGTLLVSTPNKAYYAEMRAKVGPNPFHCHEFEYEEFQAALYAVFPHVRIWAQNHAETIVFAPLNPRASVLEAAGDAAPANAHFFLAACSPSPIETDDVFAWLPASGNVLREREHHIAKLEGELARKDAWLEELKASHASLHRSHEATLAELRDRTVWAQQQNARIDERNALIQALQSEAEERRDWIRNLEKDLARGGSHIERLSGLNAELENELEVRTGWAHSLEAQLAERTEHVRLQALQIEEHLDRLLAQKHLIAQRDASILELRANLAGTEEQLEAATALHQRYLWELTELQQKHALIAQSKWIRLGRTLNLGPAVNDAPGDE